MALRKRVLVFDDDPTIRRVIATALAAEGWDVSAAADAAEAVALVQKIRPDVIVLDVVMPGGPDGFATVASLRRAGHGTPILMLSTLSDINDRLRGLRQGADDYLGKPFDLRELTARVAALLRRARPEGTPPRHLRFGAVRADLEARCAWRGDTPLALTPTEFDLLELLARHLGAPVSREHMLETVWGYTRPPATRTIETHVWRLRKKLGDSAEAPRWIRNVPGVGYALHASASEANPADTGPRPPAT